MSDDNVRKWGILLKEDRENIHDELSSGRPSVIDDNLVSVIDKAIRGARRFTISTNWSTPPYSPDLTPSDYHIYLHLKRFLGGKLFPNEEIKQWFRNGISGCRVI
ncbi:hypothetical protein PR048_000835 [Dryococelus australis]|uniref:Uncharacterized protein n=1 Tax=Dryococelus australis TaxID=614101 RepID=A0ABQ9IFQ7_9NEOP|nr:hypothetical protein PR048_000835 [Dryococelus australis]